MLESLRITNYAIIDRLSVEFGPGLTVITGETGAGKSVLLGGLRLLLGERAAAESIRQGAEKAELEATFSRLPEPATKWLEEAGCSSDDSEQYAIIRREITSGGGTRNFINGRAATLAQLRELGERLIDLHGQNDHTRLMSPSCQLEMLDAAGGNQGLLTEYRKAFEEWKGARRELEQLMTGMADAERRRSHLEFELEEIRAAQLKPGEEETLEAEKRRLTHSSRLIELGNAVADSLYEGERNPVTATAILASGIRMLGEMAALDPELKPLADDAESIRFSVEDLSARIRSYSETMTSDPDQLARTDDRLDLIRKLRKKYNATIPAILEMETAIAAELDTIVHHDAHVEAARGRMETAEKLALERAAVLRKARATASAAFEKRVRKVMQELELPRATLRIPVESEREPTIEELTANGADAVDFLVSLNVGQDPRPLRKVASGGETSRIMLAIKTVLAEKDRIPTLIFDEIDTGISGEAATRVGEKLSKLGESHQVIGITHLAQVAAKGTAHLLVEKFTRGGATVTSVRRLEASERTEALARMLGGANVDETSIRFAESLLQRTR